MRRSARFWYPRAEADTIRGTTHAYERNVETFLTILIGGGVYSFLQIFPFLPF